jgi:orotidine-5'-phosphate decarboxylase
LKWRAGKRENGGVTTSNLVSRKPIPREERLIFALDVPGPDEARRLVDELGDAVRFYKLGLQLFMAGGYYELIEWMRARGKKVFVDLKFFDVPETVKLAVDQLNNRGIEFVTVHGNDKILRAAAEAKKDVKILGVTALTSLDRGDLDDLGFACDVEKLVLSRARRALAVGCDGVISSGMEAKTLKAELGEKLMVVCPGIRPVDNTASDDQKRTVDVHQAFGNGADYIVVGRPIRNASNPRAKAEEIQGQIAGVFAR